MTQINSWLELAQAIEDKKQLEIKCFGLIGKWADADLSCCSLYDMKNMVSCGDIRIKPALKRIDLSGLVGKPVICEFFADDGWYIAGFLTEIDSENTEFTNKHGQTGDNCRPLFNHPHANTGGPCPIPKGFVFSLRMESGELFEHKNYWDDVFWNEVAYYTITGIAEGYEL